MKIVKCTKCNTEFKAIRPCMCSDCKNIYKPASSKRICKICGSEYWKGEKCTNTKFCDAHKKNVIIALVEHFGLDKTAVGTNRIFNEFERVRANIERVYNQRKLSLKQLAALYNWKVDTRKMQWLLNDIGVEINDSIEEDLLKSKLCTSEFSNVKRGSHITWDGKKVYLRSSLELEFAKQLDTYHVRYNTEAFSIKYWDSIENKERLAKPDFYLPDINTIIEIKSTYTLDRQNMKDKEKAYQKAGYNFELHVDNKVVKDY